MALVTNSSTVTASARRFGTPADQARSTASIVDEIVAQRRRQRRSPRGILCATEVSFGIIGKLLCSLPLVIFFVVALRLGVWFSPVGVASLIVFGAAWIAYLTHLWLPRR